MADLSEPLTERLTFDATISVTEMFNAGADAANDDLAFPRAQLLERLDNRTCPLCESVDGMIFEVDSPEYAVWRGPSHSGCRRIWAYLAADDPGRANFVSPDPKLILKHGGYMAHPEKLDRKPDEYAIPAAPAG